MSARRYPVRTAPEPEINRDFLGAHMQATLLDLVHRGAPTEAVQGLEALAANVADHWSLSGNARVVWLRLCGLDSDGHVPLSMLRRMRGERGPEGDQRFGDGFPSDDPDAGRGEN